ncbi:hypothetical protein [Georgenia ruanii]|uniref:hypothetical protein n=1 Tax=Georgenia ruanii TaxID=348442 RepID=UPI0012658858|nr:hypothetical protein [Georgenia ruanii]
MLVIGGTAGIAGAAAGTGQAGNAPPATGQAELRQGESVASTLVQGTTVTAVGNTKAGPAPTAAPKVPKPVPVKLKEKAQLEPAVSARLVGLGVTQAEGHGPGDLSGDAYAVTVEITNGSGRPLDMSNVVVTLDAADGTPASPVQGDPDAKPMMGKLPPGKATTGTYLFSLPRTGDTGVRVSFTYAAGTPTAIFSGDASSL